MKEFFLTLVIGKCVDVNWDITLLSSLSLSFSLSLSHLSLSLYVCMCVCNFTLADMMAIKKVYFSNMWLPGKTVFM